METVRPVDSGHGIIGCSGDLGNGTGGPIRVFKPTVSSLTIPLVEDVSEVLVCYSLGVYETQSNPQATRVIA
jgi:hypothetical protein